MLYYFGVFGATVLAKQLLYNRIPLCDKYFNYRSGKIALDYRISRVLDVYLCLCTFNIIEYYIRHIAGYHGATFIFSIWNSSIILLCLTTLSLIFFFYFDHKAKSHFTA